jgi:hypothetical protein
VGNIDPVAQKATGYSKLTITSGYKTYKKIPLDEAEVRAICSHKVIDWGNLGGFEFFNSP